MRPKWSVRFNQVDNPSDATHVAWTTQMEPQALPCAYPRSMDLVWLRENNNPLLSRPVSDTHIMQGDDYHAFLVELRREGKPHQYLSLDNTLSIVWVECADDAIHFARRSDAERMTDDAPDDMDVHICGHMWPGGTPRDRVVQYWKPEGNQ